MSKIPPVKFWKDTGKYEAGPNELQKRYFIRKMSPENRPHWHTQDVLVSVGGFGSGKTVGMNTLIGSTLCEVPKVKGIIGGIDLPLLKRNTIPTFMEFFTLAQEWDHPAVKNRLSDQQNTLRYANASRLDLVNLTNFLKLVGANAGIIGIEEPHLLEDEGSYFTLLGRLREPIPDIRQLILCTNPEKTKDGWMNTTFEMHRLEGKDTSAGPAEILVGTPCQCQICTKCRLSYGLIVPWEKDGLDYRCPKCLSKKDFWTWLGQRYFCPGDQQYTRVVKSESMHNKHLPDDYFQSMADKYDPLTFRIMVKGETNLDIRQDFVYCGYDESKNMVKSDIPINWNKEVWWSLDFNKRPQCSILCQPEVIEGKELIVAKHEIVMYGPTMDHPYGGSTATDVALHFVHTFKEEYNASSKPLIRIYGDPTGYTNVGTRELTKYAELYEVLTAHGFVVEVMQTSARIPKKERLDNINNLLRQGNLVINSSCLHLLKSMADLKGKDNNKYDQDENGDHAARRTNNPRKIYTLTHIGDALGYVLWMEKNMLSEFQPPGGISIVGKVHIEQTPEGIKKEYIEAPETTKKYTDSAGMSLVTQLNMQVDVEIQADVERLNNMSLNGLLGHLNLNLWQK